MLVCLGVLNNVRSFFSLDFASFSRYNICKKCQISYSGICLLNAKQKKCFVCSTMKPTKHFQTLLLYRPQITTFFIFAKVGKSWLVSNDERFLNTKTVVVCFFIISNKYIPFCCVSGR